MQLGVFTPNFVIKGAISVESAEQNISISKAYQAKYKPIVKTITWKYKVRIKNAFQLFLKQI